MTAPICPYCNKKSKLVKGREVYPRSPSLGDKDIYQCKPCDALVGCHPGTITPLGRLANAQLRKAKMAAHVAFDLRWVSAATGRGSKRRIAYQWLADQLNIDKEECHIGYFDLEMCKRVVEVCRAQR